MMADGILDALKNGGKRVLHWIFIKDEIALCKVIK